MSISLNNHEDRIRALENSSSGNDDWLTNQKSITKNTVIYLNNPANNYSFLWMNIVFIFKQNGVRAQRIYQCMIKPSPTHFHIGYLDLGFEVELTGDYTAMVVKDVYNTVVNSDFTNIQLATLSGLKLYYNFSYNIRRILVTHLQNLLRRCKEYVY